MRGRYSLLDRFVMLHVATLRSCVVFASMGSALVSFARRTVVPFADPRLSGPPTAMAVLERSTSSSSPRKVEGIQPEEGTYIHAYVGQLRQASELGTVADADTPLVAAVALCAVQSLRQARRGPFPQCSSPRPRALSSLVRRHRRAFPAHAACVQAPKTSTIVFSSSCLVRMLRL